MKSREAKSAPSADLLVCFPPRAHLALMPKPICSPARQSDRRPQYQRHNHHLKRVPFASPLLWAKNKQLDSEPTSPKVTCAGQIKVRPGPGNCKNWQSVMEEIERIHKKKKKKKPSWVESLGFKKDILHFLACLRTIRFDLRCFREFPQSEDDEDDDEEEEEEEEQVLGDNHQAVNDDSSRAVFSKWFMVLQENQSGEKNQGNCEVVPAVPPPNALLLMRCRSAPAKSWMDEKEEEDYNIAKDQCEEEMGRERRSRNLRSLLDEEKENVKQNNMVLMKYDAGLCKISTDISTETWVIGGTTRDSLSRSTSWKR